MRLLLRSSWRVAASRPLDGCPQKRGARSGSAAIQLLSIFAANLNASSPTSSPTSSAAAMITARATTRVALRRPALAPRPGPGLVRRVVCRPLAASRDREEEAARERERVSLLHQQRFCEAA